ALSLAGTAVALALAVLAPEILGPDLWRHRALVVVGILGVPLLAFRDLATNALAAARATRASASLGLALAVAAAIGGGVGVLARGSVLGFLAGSLAGEAAALALAGVGLGWRLATARAREEGRGRPDGHRDEGGRGDRARDDRREVTVTALILWAAYSSYP